MINPSFVPTMWSSNAYRELQTLPIEVECFWNKSVAAALCGKIPGSASSNHQNLQAERRTAFWVHAFLNQLQMWVYEDIKDWKETTWNYICAWINFCQYFRYTISLPWFPFACKVLEVIVFRVPYQTTKDWGRQWDFYRWNGWLARKRLKLETPWGSEPRTLWRVIYQRAEAKEIKSLELRDEETIDPRKTTCLIRILIVVYYNPYIPWLSTDTVNRKRWTEHHGLQCKRCTATPVAPQLLAAGRTRSYSTTGRTMKMHKLVLRTKKKYFGWSQDNYFTAKFPSLNVNKHTAAAAVRLKAALQPDAVRGSGLILCSDLFQSFAHLGPWN